MEIRTWRPGDAIVGDEVWHGEALDVPRRRRTFVADDGGVVIGNGTLWWSRRHPDIVFSEIEVDPAHRRRGAATGLLRAMLAEADVPPVFIADVGSREERFLSASGFEARVESHTETARIGDVLPMLDIGALPDGITVDTSDSITPEIADAYDRIYGYGHRWAGRYTPPPGEPWIDFAGEVVDGTVAVARFMGEILGVTSLHVGSLAEGTDGFLPPTGILAELTRREKRRVMSVMLERTLCSAAQGGAERFALERDEPYRTLTEMVATWPTEHVRSRRGWCPAEWPPER